MTFVCSLVIRYHQNNLDTHHYCQLKLLLECNLTCSYCTLVRKYTKALSGVSIFLFKFLTVLVLIISNAVSRLHKVYFSQVVLNCFDFSSSLLLVQLWSFETWKPRILAKKVIKKLLWHRGRDHFFFVHL